MISGSIVALVTPMTPSGDVDYEALKNLIEWHISSGTNAIVAVGTTGESATLSISEHHTVIKTVVEIVDNRIPVIAGTGANSTREAIALTKVAKDVGANACLSVTPYYNKPTQEGLYLHHKAIAEAVDIPNILYNVPGRTAVDMSLSTTLRLSEVSNIIGIKDATGDLSRGAELIRSCGDKMLIYSGDDPTATELLMMGAHGSISVTANIIPMELSLLYRRAAEAKTDQERQSVRDANKKFASLNNNLFVEANPIPVKWALNYIGKISRGIRLPLTPLDSTYHDLLKNTLIEAGAIKNN